MLVSTGLTGNGISSITKTGTSGLVDTYTITYTNGNTTTFDVSNGNGIDRIEKTATVGNKDTYTIYFTNGSTTTYEVANGEVTREELEEEVDRLSMIYNAFPSTSNEGEEMTLNGTAEVPFKKLNLKGNTSQFSTTGKNLFDKSNDLANAIQQQAQMTKSGSGKECTLTKATSGSASPRITFNDDFFEVNTTYYISFKIKGNCNKFWFGTWINDLQVRLSDIIVPTNQYQIVTGYFTYPANKTSQDRIFFKNNDEFVEVGQTLTITDFMISKTNDTTYEPYTNGASPNPDYPQDIQVVSGDNTINVEGKNLFNNNVEVKNAYVSSNIGSAINYVNSTATVSYVNCCYLESGTTYTISYEKNTPASTSQRGSAIVDINNTVLEMIQLWDNNNTSITFTPTYSGYLVCVVDKNSTNIQIEKGSTATEYEEFKGQSYEINLGKNLLDFSNATGGTNSGVSVVINSDGTFTANGTSTSSSVNIWFIGNYSSTTTLFTLTPGTYYIKDVNLYSYDGTTHPSLQPGVRTLTSNFNVSAVRFPTEASGTEHDNKIYYPQVEKRSQATSYSPYKTPIELCKIGDYQDYIRKSTGKNLFDKDNDITANTGLTSQGGTFSSNDYCMKSWLELKANTQYTLSDNDNTKTKRICFYSDKTESSFINVVEQGKKSVTFTTPANCKYVRIQIKQTELNYEMLNEGSTALPYEPYGKVWYLNKQIGKVVLDGSENWGTSQYGTNSWSLNGVTSVVLDTTKIQIMNTKFKGVAKEDRNTTDSVIYTDSNTGIIIRNTPYTTKAEVQSGMSGTPIYYIPATPTTTEITDTTLIEQLDNLEKAYSYDTQTNISQTNADKPFILDVEAILSLKNILD